MDGSRGEVPGHSLSHSLSASRGGHGYFHPVYFPTVPSYFPRHPGPVPMYFPGPADQLRGGVPAFPSAPLSRLTGGPPTPVTPVVQAPRRGMIHLHVKRNLKPQRNTCSGRQLR